jgi:hypothetical protein
MRPAPLGWLVVAVPEFASALVTRPDGQGLGGGDHHQAPTGSADRASKVATVTGQRRQRLEGADHHQVGPFRM